MNAIRHYMWRVNPEIAMSKFIESNVAVSVLDDEGRIIYANNRFCNILGFEEKELFGVNNCLIKTNTHKDPFYRNLWKTIENGNIWSGVLSCKLKTEVYFSLETTIVPLKDEDGNIESYIAMYIDVTNSNTAFTESN